MIYTNIDIENMYNEIKKHLKNITNKKYIQDFINLQFDYKLITQKEKKELEKEFIL